MKYYALCSKQGTACAETVLTEAEYADPAMRAQTEARFCKGGPDDPVPGTWADVTDNPACAPVMEYELTVTFRRSLSDDLDVAEAGGITGSKVERLVKQLCRELQEAYDNGGMAGSFQIDPASYKEMRG